MSHFLACLTNCFNLQGVSFSLLAQPAKCFNFQGVPFSLLAHPTVLTYRVSHCPCFAHSAVLTYRVSNLPCLPSQMFQITGCPIYLACPTNCFNLQGVPFSLPYDIFARMSCYSSGWTRIMEHPGSVSGFQLSVDPDTGNRSSQEVFVYVDFLDPVI